MLLCIDVGNTQIHGGVFNGKELVLQFRKTCASSFHPMKLVYFCVLFCVKIKLIPIW